MDETIVSQDGGIGSTDSSSDRTGNEPNGGNADGSQQENSGGDWVDEYLSAGTSGNGEGGTPAYTLPPSVSVKSKRGRKPGTKNKTKVTQNSGISSEACAAAMQALFSGVSYATTGTLELSLTGGEKLGAEALDPADEAGSLGKALAACFDTIPNNPVAKYFNVAAPWLAFIGLLSTVLISKYIIFIQLRMRMMELQNEGRRQRTQQNPPPPPTQQKPPPTSYEIFCPICGEQMATQSDLQTHTKGVHGI